MAWGGSQLIELKVESTFKPSSPDTSISVSHPGAPDSKYLGRASGIYNLRKLSRWFWLVFFFFL